MRSGGIAPPGEARRRGIADAIARRSNDARRRETGRDRGRDFGDGTLVSDVGFTHVALLVGNLDASVAFYAKYAHMEVVHRRSEGSSRVAWVSDRTRPFVIVLIEIPTFVPRPFLRWANGLLRLLVQFEHMGVWCAS